MEKARGLPGLLWINEAVLRTNYWFLEIESRMVVSALTFSIR